MVAEEEAELELLAPTSNGIVLFLILHVNWEYPGIPQKLMGIQWSPAGPTFAVEFS